MKTSPVGTEERGKYQLGVSRPPMDVADLPSPEEVFGVPRIGRRELVTLVIGPSLIALGISIGSGEWLLGPLNVGQLGFEGIGFVIFLSVLLQTVYNIEFARYVMATGETPIAGFGRVPPGKLLWVPFSLVTLFFAFMWGGWAKGAATGLYAMIHSEVPGPGDAGRVELYTVLLLLAAFGIILAARRITRALELFNGAAIVLQVGFLVVIDLVFVDGDVWWDGVSGFITPAMPPEGIDATKLGGLVGFAAMVSGLNWLILGHYRDKGYGMGTHTGFIAGMRAEANKVRPVGVTFPDDERNRAMWARWMHYLRVDMWGVFFPGALIGMLLPTILMRQVVLVTGEQPTDANIPTFIATALDGEYGGFVFRMALLVGFLILFDTQVGLFEALARNATDGLSTSTRFCRLVGDDPRRFYFPFMFALVVATTIIILSFQPARLILISANMSNFGALVFPFLIIYLNRRLPAPARPKRGAYVALALNFVFFGFFFINFLYNEITGDALVTF